MKARTEELLYLLLWGCHQLARPTFRNLTDSFESWSYREGLHAQLHRLEGRQLLERQPGRASEMIYRLSEAGRLVALGGHDPEACWARPWDRRWRLVLFDLPETKNKVRVKLRRFLRDSGFGYLQKSVWITPEPLIGILKNLSTHAKEVESLVTWEATTAAGETDEQIVSGAWDFEHINGLYERCREIYSRLPDTERPGASQNLALSRWAQEERSSWKEAVSADPLLPARLLPKDYLGKKAWEQRKKTLAAAAKLIQ
jgi:phenylacetic acid degradation operon negative regulatory protein